MWHSLKLTSIGLAIAGLGHLLSAHGFGLRFLLAPVLVSNCQSLDGRLVRRLTANGMRETA